jgi:hypothetical protein
MSYKKVYREKNIQKLRNIMYMKGFMYNGIDGWFDPHGNATGIYWNDDGWFTIWEQKIN